MTGDRSRVALVTAAPARGLDDDLPPLTAALAAAGVPHEVVLWDDPGVDWAGFGLVVIRSVWDYVHRREEFLAWAERTAAVTAFVNPPAHLRWSSDKRYLADLQAAGVPTVPTAFAAPGEPMAWPDAPQVVVKPAVSAGSIDTSKYRMNSGGRSNERTPADAVEHVARLHAEGRVAMAQPYLDAVEGERGETALVFLEGRFSHACRKGPMLVPGLAVVGGLFVEEDIRPAAPTAAELAVAEATLAAIPGGPSLYARVDVIPDGAGDPVVLELELVEPSLFLMFAEGGAGRVAGAIAARLSRGGPTAPA
ncbi:MAG: RimK family alpha-L-glutamate ligase [Thermoleophilia bacterium]